MEHVVYLDTKAEEFEKLDGGSKTMVIRGATGRKMPYGRVEAGDELHFIRNNGEGMLVGEANVKSVLNSDKMTPEESKKLVKDNQDKLQLTDKQFDKWGGKRYIVFVEVESFKKTSPKEFDKSPYGNMDDWIPLVD